MKKVSQVMCGLLLLPIYDVSAAEDAAEKKESTVVCQSSDENCVSKNNETMVVKAKTPVPVPVNGNTYYDEDDIKRLPTRNGNVSDLLRTNPAVRLDTTASDSMNQGELRPEKISIHGASPYQNLFLIDGMSATNNLNPANESDASSATNISGTSQGYFLDISLLDHITVYDSNVPVEFGHFNGGVIDASVRRFSGDNQVKLNYRTTRDEWLQEHIDPSNKESFDQGSSGSNYYSPKFRKNFYTLSIDQTLTENTGVTAGFSRRQSDITRASLVTGDEAVGDTKHKNIIDTALVKLSWLPDEQITHDLTLKYTHSNREYNTAKFPESGRKMGNDALGAAWDFSKMLEIGKLSLTAGWDHMEDFTKHNNTEWYTEKPCTYEGITGQCTRGGLGHISQEVDNFTAKARQDFVQFETGSITHKSYIGAEYVHSDASTQRHNKSEAYMINTNTGKITNHSIYNEGKGSLNIDSGTLYAADRMTLGNVAVVPGVRYDYDTYLKNNNVSPRFLTEWDVLGDRNTMLSAGYNRYYGGNILNMGLKDIRQQWTESASATTNVTRYQDLKTPYNDELSFGLQQRIDNVLFGANYVNRHARDQINSNSKTDTATKQVITTYNNDGKSKADSVNLSLELVEPLTFSDIEMSPQVVFSWLRNKGNLSLNSGYDDSTVETNGDMVVYNGSLMHASDVPVKDFNTPWNISFNMDFAHAPSGLVWANTVTYQQARKARLALSRTNADYNSDLSDYKQFQDKKLSSSVNWDSRISWTPQFIPSRNLTVSVDALNVLNKKTAVNTDAKGVSAYGSGRQYWLDVELRF